MPLASLMQTYQERSNGRSAELDSTSRQVRTALRALPPVGEDVSGPLGPGLLASGQLGNIIRDLQAGLREVGSR